MNKMNIEGKGEDNLSQDTPIVQQSSIKQKKSILMVVLTAISVFFSPIGLLILWIFTRWSKKTKLLLSAVGLVLFAFSIFLNNKLNQKTHTLQNQSTIDIKNMQPIGFEYSNYVTDGTYAYCNDGGNISKFDLSSLKVIDPYYATDSQTVYYACQPLLNSDPKTFIRLDSCYSKDSNQVYTSFNILSQADPNSFEDLGICYGKDNKTIYLSGEPIANADIKTFELDGSSYSHDKNQVFYFGQPIFGADPSSMVFMGYSYFRDKNYIYYNGKAIEESDPRTSSFIGPYIKDKNGIYNEGILVTDIDLATAKYLGYLYIVDKSHVYYDGIIIPNADIKTFSVINKIPENVDTYYSKVYAKDNNTVYYGSDPIYEADPATFEIDETHQLRAKDKNNRYYREKIDSLSSKNTSTLFVNNNACKPVNSGYSLPNKIIPLFLRDATNKGFEAIVRKYSQNNRVYFDLTSNQLPDSKAPYQAWILFPDDKNNICGGVLLGDLIKDPTTETYNISFNDYDYNSDSNIIVITSGKTDGVIQSLNNPNIILKGSYEIKPYIQPQ